MQLPPSPSLRIDRGFRPRWSKWRSILVATVVFWVLLGFLYQSKQAAAILQFHADTKPLRYPESAKRLWNNLLPLLEDAAPDVATPDVDPDAVSTMWEANAEIELMDKTNMKHADILKMQRAHQLFTSQMKTRMYGHIPTKGGARRGIVTVAGGNYMPAAIVSLRLLRRTGSTLPVEFWIADDKEYEEEICEQVLPKLNARCRVLIDVFDTATREQRQDIIKFQYKIFAILFSSFDEVLFLDSDSFPLRNPEEIFESEVYKRHGMITWPDLWATSISPAYYLIAGREPPPIILRASTESGQFLINKKTHFETLLISAYYNYYGPNHYYILLCQGGYGRGDKSTFIPAAIAANQTFYDVSERPRPIGQMFDWLEIFALLQYDAQLDYNLTSHGKWRSKNPEVAPPIRPYFVHTVNPKWNPVKLFGQHDEGHGFSNDATKNSKGEPSLAYVDPPEDVATVSWVERQLWEETRWVACELEHKFKGWKDKKDVCKNVQDWFKNFLDTPAGAPKPYPPPPSAEEKSDADQHSSSDNDNDPSSQFDLDRTSEVFKEAGLGSEDVSKILETIKTMKSSDASKVGSPVHGPNIKGKPFPGQRERKP
ncbi:hypothetical protein MBLNU457_g0605t1 [Dothideomycetes sp. NU457]